MIFEAEKTKNDKIFFRVYGVRDEEKILLWLMSFTKEEAKDLIKTIEEVCR